ncbi:hypothetical protein CSE45_1709 [Citreicella sp. SE45]|uniref:Uncharacterized protein n=1 Tax=Salipiger thiooxidans TaxID=282683 RepID=A0A1G7HQ34_9RHOB|nr:hypothetical protein [Salipiger thiooxidans]EEX14538.1 hypothetical protein CSE45_1709 [Citreicella sp. SE45]NVK60977.1 hypothetical protein [Paracoccaceae bacterium]SDF02572.1 hypothetical protein SAMN04488105_111102 [Salipiger thiooxidans]
MQTELETRRRVLHVTYERYLAADAAWQAALSEMRRWFPASSRPYRVAIGDPGSPIRALYESRSRALAQLETARVKFETAKRRLAARRERTTVHILLH